MSRIAIPAIESATGATADIYAQVIFTSAFNRINGTDVDFPPGGSSM